MKKYLLVTIVKGTLANAGPKAPGDICKILADTGMVENLYFSTEEGMDYPVFLHAMFRIKKAAADGREIILQYPLQPYFYHDKQALYAQLLECLNPDKTVIFLHDINHLRFTDMAVYQSEMEWLKPFRRYIVHNRQMEDYLRKYIQIDQCIHNEIFDYLCDEGNRSIQCHQFTGNSPAIIFAGNMEKRKSPFLYELRGDKMNFRINLYGRRETTFENPKLNYCGSFPADILPGKLKGDIGLIWDGEADALSDRTAQRDYTRYNMPHKFSCYMAAGLPVIAWKGAAVAETIMKYHVGYLVDNLYGVNDLDLVDYEECRKNAESLGCKVREGYFTRRVLEKLQEKTDVLI